MEKRTCKLCFKTFSNGRALGGHMRSHMLKLQTPPPLPTPSPTPPPNVQLSSHVHHLQNTQLIHQLDGNETADSASSSSSASEEEQDEDEEDDDDDKGLSYGLRENPKKSFRLVDPEFSSFAVDAGSVVQDRESETESSKHPSRRRSKRNRKSGFVHQHHDGVMTIKKNKPNKSIPAESSIEPEPVSSVSDTTPEEDVAWCLMMLSRGIRTRNINEVIEVEEEQEPEEEDEDQDDQEDDKSIEESDEELEEIKIRVKRSRGKYQCGTCKKFFRSYQALGGHRASHKKIKGCNINNNNNMNINMNMNMNMSINTHTPSSSSLPVRNNSEAEYEQQEGNAVSVVAAPRIHECPVCFRVFGSGQALGGHKRSHITGSASLQPIRIPNSTRFENNLIDLNLPAPMEDEDQIELSAVSDGEFIH